MSILRRLFRSKTYSAAHPGQPSTFRQLLRARTSPWDRVPTPVIDAIFDALGTTELFDPFVLASMEAKLLKQFEAMDADFEALPLARARISMILSQAGFRELDRVVSDVKAGRVKQAREHGRLVADLFDTAIAFSSDQIGGYLGMAGLFGLLGVKARSAEYARRGLDELKRIRNSDAGRAMSKSAALSSTINDTVERQLREFLSDAE